MSILNRPAMRSIEEDKKKKLSKRPKILGEAEISKLKPKSSELKNGYLHKQVTLRRRGLFHRSRSLKPHRLLLSA
jgi:hypothetical protein